MRDLAEFLTRLNDIDFKYVVMRNWENLPYNAETGPHSDLDLLVYDFDHFLELHEDLKRVYPAPRVQFRLYFDSGEYTQIDVRSVGDGYYPEEFQEAMLKTREWNERGFWTPNPIHHRIGLVYHCVHHKNANTYPNFLGQLTVKEMLDSVRQNSELAWVQPDDPSVGRFNAYQTGATAVVSQDGSSVEKKQVRYKAYNLTDNEERALKKLDNPHFPKLISRDGDSIRIEHCGEPLHPDNLPKDWEKQLDDILGELDKAGIVHRDIRKDNLMVKEGVIKLLDFGWARLASEEDGKHPDLLGYPNKCPLGFNDRYSMNRVIKQIKAEMEELCQKTK